MPEESQTAVVQWWLASLDQHGNPTLCDGAHATREGPEKAAYLFGQLGLGRGQRYACARVEITPVEARAHGANGSALRALNEIGLS
jgi:hypothetical protein